MSSLLTAPLIAGLLPARTFATPNSVYDSEFFETCARVADASVDMILCDLPYGTTACSWDVIIPFEPMWKEFKRIIKPRGAIVLTASQPFTSLLVMSNLQLFRYEWIWEKTIAANFMNAKYQPQKKHENILVFGIKSPVYYPELQQGDPYRDNRSKNNKTVGILNTTTAGRTPIVNTGWRYPSSLIEFSNGNNDTLHPTQKPVDLFAYLIRTYTQPGDLVFDPTCGSGTTAIAARNEGRSFIVADNGTDERTGKRWAEITRERLAQPYTLPLFAAAPPTPAAVQLGFGD